jgi:hypothetical protein
VLNSGGPGVGDGVHAVAVHGAVGAAGANDAYNNKQASGIQQTSEWEVKSGTSELQAQGAPAGPGVVLVLRVQWWLTECVSRAVEARPRVLAHPLADIDTCTEEQKSSQARASAHRDRPRGETVRAEIHDCCDSQCAHSPHRHHLATSPLVHAPYAESLRLGRE